MKSTYKILLALSALILVKVSLPDRKSDPRAEEKINLNWKFIHDDDSAFCTPGFDDSAWKIVTLPHDWMSEGEVNGANRSAAAEEYSSAGTGWYRNHLDLSEFDGKDQFYLLFDGTGMNTDVWINGTWLGNQISGNRGFHFDISDYVRKDTTNIIAVRTNCSQSLSKRGHQGGSIYRNVKLIATEKVHFPLQNTIITTTNRNSERVVTFATKILNNTNKAGRYKVRSKLFSPEGELIERSVVVGLVEGVCSAEVAQELTISTPEFWSDRNPVLYILKTEIIKNGRVVDNIQTAFGVRDAHLTSDSELLLNGRKIELKGVSIHYDGGALGAEVPGITWEHRLKAIKALGINAIRLTHNPYSSEILEMCDRVGLFVIGEMDNEQEIVPCGINGGQLFAGSTSADLPCFIKCSRNNPSAVAWNIGDNRAGLLKDYATDGEWIQALAGITGESGGPQETASSANHTKSREPEDRERLSVIDNLNPNPTPYESERRRVRQDTHLVVIQSTSEPGDLTISALAQGLTSANLISTSILP